MLCVDAKNLILASISFLRATCQKVLPSDSLRSKFLEQTLKERMINYSILNALKEYVITSYEI